ncbi:MAG: tetratricopeptide repeat protein [Deltaproteobacteria bacterium]|nr:tetratricopeptide repeat protein [Deltaproteobacteria bacterium]
MVASNDVDRATALRQRGNSFLVQGNGRGAKKAFLAARALVGDDDPLAAGQIASGLGRALHLLGDTDAAIDELESALALLVGHLGELHAEVALCANNLGLAWVDEDLWNAAAAMQYAKAIGDHVYAADAPQQATTLSNLAYMCSEAGQPATAIAYSERALAMQERTLSPWHLDVALTLSNLAHYHRELGQGDERALSLALQLATVVPELVKTDDETAASIAFSTGTLVLELAHDPSRAAGLYETALAMRVRLRNPVKTIVNTVRNASARLFVAGATEVAIAFLERVEVRGATMRTALPAQLAAVRAGDRDAVLEGTELEPDDEDEDDSDHD